MRRPHRVADVERVLVRSPDHLEKAGKEGPSEGLKLQRPLSGAGESMIERRQREHQPRARHGLAEHGPRDRRVKPGDGIREANDIGDVTRHGGVVEVGGAGASLEQPTRVRQGGAASEPSERRENDVGEDEHRGDGAPGDGTAGTFKGGDEEEGDDGHRTDAGQYQ
jgi:hypothetical protein